MAIIKSCGGSSWLISRVFLGFGGCVGLLGVVIGCGLGWVFMRHINTVEQWIFQMFGLRLWKSSVYVFDKIPSQVDWSAVCQIALAAVVATTSGSKPPGIATAPRAPLDRRSNSGPRRAASAMSAAPTRMASG